MTLSFQTLKKVCAGIFISALMFSALAPFASAQTYYYTQATQSQPNVQALLNQLYALIAQLQAMQGGNYGYAHQNQYSYSTPVYVTTPSSHYSYGDYDIDVTTEDYDVESDDTVTLFGELDLDSAPYAEVWFEYGTDGDLDEESDTQKLTRDESFDIEVDGLDEDENYYFRAVAEDPAGYRVYGSIKGFQTDEDDDDDDSNDDDIPDATTDDAENIDEDQAELHGEIDMNDFEDGLAFFVYGEDEDAVMDVEDEDSYSDIDEDGDDLQKVQVASSFDGSRTFWTTVYNLDDDTEHFFRICVEYEDEDDDETLECGDVESFDTDEN